jgi:hypothetical protein
MKKFRSPACPYCGKKVNPIRTWCLKKQGEYQCGKCQGISNIVLDPTMSLFGVSAIFLSVLIFLIFKFFVGEVNLLCVILMILPFLIFNLLALFLVRLKKPVFRKVPKGPNGSNEKNSVNPATAKNPENYYTAEYKNPMILPTENTPHMPPRKF